MSRKGVRTKFAEHVLNRYQLCRWLTIFLKILHFASALRVLRKKSCRRDEIILDVAWLRAGGLFLAGGLLVMKKPCKSSNSRMSGAVGSGNSSSDGSIERSDHSSTGSLSRSYEASDLGATPSDSAAAYGSASSVTMTPLVCKKSIRGREGSHSSRTSSSGESGAGVSDLERRIVSLFQKQSEKEVTDSEESRELNKR